MADIKKINTVEKERASEEHFSSAPTKAKEIQETQTEIVETVESLDESGEAFTTGEVGEKEKGGKEGYQGGGSGSGASSDQSRSKAAPSDDVLIEQTIRAIDVKIAAVLKETTKLRKSNNSSPIKINALVIEARNLTQLKYKLKNASNLARDYLVGLWNQYVRGVRN